MKTINWYPGHMKKTRELIEEHLKLVDVVLEICDARIPVSSRNPILAEITKGKPRVIILNKNDLADESATKDWIRFLCKAEESEKILTVAEINALSGKGVKELLRILEKTSADPEAVSGKTGIPLRLMVIGVPNSGKSSLINAIFPELSLRTGEISTSHNKGMHTTTFSEMFELGKDSYVIDTPGIKGFGTIDFSKEEVGHFFPEIFNVSKECRFNNCTHIHEPGCAVLRAIGEHKISQSRYQSYLSILEDCDAGKYR